MVIAGLVAGVLVPAQQASAQTKPMLVVAFSGYNELHTDLEFIGEISENPELANSLDGLLAVVTQFQGLVGLDKSKPWGASVSSDGQAFQTLVFLPVTDLQKLFGALANFVGEPKDSGDGIWQVRVNNGMPAFVKEQAGWAFLAQSPDQLADLPKDPGALVSGLAKKYDLAVKANIQNVPQQFRDLAITQIKLGMQSGLERQDDETDAQYQLRVKIMQQQLAQLEEVINGLDEIVIGWAIDPKSRSAYLDFSLTAMPGSKLAQNAAAASTIKSKLAGFLESDKSLVDGHIASKQGPDDIESTLSLVKSLRTTVMDSIDKEDDLKDDEKPVVKKVVGEGLDVVEATVKKGVFDGGFVIVGEGPFTLAAGALIEEGKRLESAFKQALELVKGKPDAPEIKLNAETHAGVTFHTLSGPWPPNDNDNEQAKKLLGDELVVTFGFAADRVFVAVGEDGIDTIKSVIDDSASAKSPELPFEVHAWLEPILEYAAEQQPDNPILKTVADSLDEDDGIHLTSRMIKNGAMSRLEFDEGVLKAIGMAGAAAQKQQRRR
jgi:hypothetical protein